jgi:hypothetical protein
MSARQSSRFSLFISKRINKKCFVWALPLMGRAKTIMSEHNSSLKAEEILGDQSNEKMKKMIANEKVFRIFLLFYLECVS